MAEQFLEEIYADAKVIDELWECIGFIARTDYKSARIKFNTAMEHVESILEKYAVENVKSANYIQNCAIDIIDSWGNWGHVTGAVRGKLIQGLFEYMSQFCTIDVEEDGIRISSADSGFLTLEDLQENMFLHDTHDPMRESGEIAEMLYDPKTEKYILFGCGLGYLGYKLWEKSGEAAQIVMYEDDDRIVNYARHYGVLDWIDEDCLQIRCIPNINKAIEEFYKEIDLTDEKRVTYVTPYKKKKYKDAYNGKFLALVYRIEHVWISRDVNEINIWKNRKLVHEPFKTFYQKLKSDTWIVVAAGPSLNYNMDFIMNRTGIDRIVAVNTVLRKLCHEGLVPDLSVAADPFGQLQEHLDGIEDYTKDIPMIADWLLCWKYAYRYKGEKCFIPTPAGECIKNYNPNNDDVWDVFGTVSALAIEAAVRLGAKKVYLVGLDLAFPGGEVHADGMPHEKFGYKSEAMLVPSVNERVVETTPVFNDFRLGIEQILERNPEIDFINMSKDGALIKGARRP